MSEQEIDWNARGAPLDTLIALCEEGPLWDGDVPSKRERDELVRRGLACRISVKGEQGYNAATYMGNNAYTRLFNAHSIKEAKSIRLANRALNNMRVNSKKSLED